MSELQYTLSVVPTLNGMPQATIGLLSGESRAQGEMAQHGFMLTPGGEATFQNPDDGQGMGIFASRRIRLFLLDAGASMPIDLPPFAGAIGSPFRVGTFLPAVTSQIRVEALDEGETDILVIGPTFVEGVAGPVFVPGDKDWITFTAVGSGFAWPSAPIEMFHSLSTLAPDPTNREVLPDGGFIADFTVQIPVGANSSDGAVLFRILINGVAVGAPITYAPGADGLQQILGDIAPVVASDRISFLMESPASTLGGLSDPHIAVRYRIT